MNVLQIENRLITLAETLKPILNKPYSLLHDNFGSPIIYFNCSFTYAKSRLIKSGFIQCENKRYIKNDKVFFYSTNFNKMFDFNNSTFID